MTGGRERRPWTLAYALRTAAPGDSPGAKRGQSISAKVTSPDFLSGFSPKRQFPVSKGLSAFDGPENKKIEPGANGETAMHGIENINPVDMGIVAAFAVAGVLGARSGILRQIVRLVTYVASVYGTIYLHPMVTTYIADNLPDAVPAQHAPAVASSLAYIVTFPALFAAIGLGTMLAHKTIRALFAPAANPENRNAASSLFPVWLDRLLGAGSSMAVTGLMLGTAFTVLTLVQVPQLEAKLAGSKLRLPLVQGVQAVAAAIPQQYKDELNEAIARLKNTGVTMTGEMLGEGLHGLSDGVNTLTSELNKVQTATRH